MDRDDLGVAVDCLNVSDGAPLCAVWSPVNDEQSFRYVRYIFEYLIVVWVGVAVMIARAIAAFARCAVMPFAVVVAGDQEVVFSCALVPLDVSDEAVGNLIAAISALVGAAAPALIVEKNVVCAVINVDAPV